MQRVPYAQRKRDDLSGKSEFVETDPLIRAWHDLMLVCSFKTKLYK